LSTAEQSRQLSSLAVHGEIQLLEITSQINPVLQIQDKELPADFTFGSELHLVQEN
jgi:hypothetical protein